MKVKHKFLNVLLAVCMVLCMTPAPVFAEDNVPASVWTDYAETSFAGGSGSAEDPYQIATAEQLAKLSKDVSNGTTYEGKFFKLTEDIDLSDHRWVPIGIYQLESSGSVTNDSFRGFIDGNNKTISGLIVDERTDKNAAGFFGNILNMYGGTVGAKNLTISNANIYAAEDGLNELHAGILAGTATANEGYQVVFENITVSGTVKIESTTGSNNVGGMIGYGSRVKATDCKAENIFVTGASNSGGFIGVDVGSVYENCEVSGTVSGTWAQGGFVGYTSTATLNDSSTQSVFKKCAADVEIEGSDWRLGGFAGYAEYGQFDTCVAFGDVTSTVTDWEPRVGGFIGESDNAIVNHCYTAGKVNSSHSGYKAGGFVGHYAGGTFTDSSFDSDKNSGLTAAGTGNISSGVEGVNSNDILTNICADYYGHKYSTEWTIDTAATCTTDGSKSQHCERCDAKRNITVIPASGHTLTKTEAKTATCIEEGYDAYWTCEICKKLFSNEAGTIEIDAPVMTSKTDHKWDAGKVTKEPTEAEEGVKTYTCSVCDKTKTEGIPKKEAASQTPEPGTETDTQQPPKKGDVVADDKGTGNYKVTDVAKKEVAYQTPADKNLATISIPATVTIGGVTYKVTSIADNAFANNKKITKVTIGNNVKTIGKKAFYKCTKLKTVTIGKNVTTIGVSAFYGCSKLSSVTMGSNVTTISDKAFYKCTALAKITIPSKVKKIGKQAFYGCKKLKSITIKTTKLTSKNVGSSAFKGIYAKATIKVPKSKLAAYKKLFKSKGVSSKVVVVKLFCNICG